MPAATIEALQQRVESIKQGLWDVRPNGARVPCRVEGAVSSTLTVLALIYGNPSPQLKQFQDQIPRGKGGDDYNGHNYEHRIAIAVSSVLDAAMSDFGAGLTTSVRVQAKGEILGDFVALAREAIDTRSDATDRVAAVLASAALEETLKQLGTIHGIEVYDHDMGPVIQKLRDAGVLVGPQAGIAHGFVKFRNHAFHGQFDLIERPTTEAALAFVEGLLTTRMS